MRRSQQSTFVQRPSQPPLPALPATPLLSRLLEHEGRVNMLKPLTTHMAEAQRGLGVVAVSKRYGER